MKTIQTHSIAAALDVLCFMVLCSQNAKTQSSLFSIPTTDIMTTGETYLEADFDSQLSSYRTGGYQSYGIFVLHGVRRQMEVGLNAYYADTGDSSRGNGGRAGGGVHLVCIRQSVAP